MNTRSVLQRIAGIVCVVAVVMAVLRSDAGDRVRLDQLKSIEYKKPMFGHWGAKPEEYSSWTNHSNRLIPIYTFGIDLAAFQGENSIYRSEEKLNELFGQLPEQTLNPEAEYFDQTDVYRLQKKAVEDGKKYVFFMVFDGMDWQTTQAAAIYRSRQIYTEGRGSGLAFLDYRTDVNDYGYFVTSPHNNGTDIDVNAQTVLNPGGEKRGGYSPLIGGPYPWSKPRNDEYPLGRYRALPHVVTDSAASATSMNTGMKTYNSSINIGPDGAQLTTIAHELQKEKEFSIGVVTSVTISHATPGCTYAHNVTRNDYQDISRDLLGLKSVSHRDKALRGVDVLIGCGWGDDSDSEKNQGENYVPGNKYLPADELTSLQVENGGKYYVAQREPGVCGSVNLRRIAKLAAADDKRLFGFYGGKGFENLPFRTADGNYDPTDGVGKAMHYTKADLYENVTLADMTRAAITVLETNKKGFWLMVEAGDVDWANHDNNLDNSIGAVISGDFAFQAIIKWIEDHDAWKDSAVILTADHGHYFVLDDPEELVATP